MFSSAKTVQRFHCGGEKVGTFDGSNDYIDTGLPSTTLRPNDGSKDYTMSIMFDMDTISSTGASGRLIVPGNGAGTRGGLEVNSEGGTARAIFRVGGSAYRSDGTGTGATAVTITTGTKFHVCATVSMTGAETAEVNLYVDGVLTRVAEGIDIDTAATTTVKIATQADAATNFFDGKIYDVRLYCGSALTATEVSELSNELLYLKYRETGGSTHPERNLILHYDFEDGFGGTDKHIT